MLSPIGDGSRQADERVRLIPPEILPLFDDTFVRSCQLIEEYVARLALESVRAAGLERACADGATVDEAIERAKLDPTAARVPVAWLLRTLAARGWAERLTADGDAARYRIGRALPAPDPEELVAILVHFFADLLARLQGHQNQLEVVTGVEHPAKVGIVDGDAGDVGHETLHANSPVGMWFAARREPWPATRKPAGSAKSLWNTRSG